MVPPGGEGVFAGQHTSSITSTWTGLLSIANKDRVIPTLEEEQRKIIKEHGKDLDFDILAKMDELHFAVKEEIGRASCRERV